MPYNYVKIVESYYYETVRLNVLFQAEAIQNFSHRRRADALSFKVGDIISVVKNSGELWEGVLKGKFGSFPSDFVKVISDDESVSPKDSAEDKKIAGPVGFNRACDHMDEGSAGPRKRSTSAPMIKKALPTPVQRVRAVSVDSALSDEDMRKEKENVSFIVEMVYKCPEYLETSMGFRFFPERVLINKKCKNTHEHEPEPTERVGSPSCGLTISDYIEEVVLRTVTCKEHQEELIYAYRYFSSPDEFLDALSSQCDHNLGSENAIRNVIAFLSEWVRVVPKDFAADYNLARKARKLLDKAETAHFNSVFAATANAKLLLEQSPTLCNYSPTTPLSSLHSAVPSKITTITKIHPTELARQLPIEGFGIFKRMSLNELCTRYWNATGMRHTSPSIAEMVSKFRGISTLVTSEVLSKKTAHKRKGVIKHFLETATESRKLRDYNTMMGIAYALCSSPVYRLGKSWNKKCLALLNEFFSLGKNNFMRLRLMTEAADGPAIPFIGEFLGRLFTVEDYNKICVKDGIITIKQSSAHEYANMCRLVSKLQQGRYSFEQSPSVLEFMGSVMKSPAVSLADAMRISCILEK